MVKGCVMSGTGQETGAHYEHLDLSDSRYIC